LYGTNIKNTNRLRVFENRVLKRIFGPMRRDKQEAGDNYKRRSFII
jgi:hypothetical protein